MDLLKAEINRKRKQLEKCDALDPSKKFFNRGDLEAEKSREYWQKYKVKHHVAAPDTEGKEISSEKVLARMEDDEAAIQIPAADVIKRLRARNEPVRLFGESDDDRARRLRRLEIDQPDFQPGWRNDFQDALDAADQEEVNEIISGKNRVEDKLKHDVKTDSKLLRFEEICEMIENLDNEDASKDCDTIFAFFNYLAQKWGFELNERSLEEKRTPEGRHAAGRFRQTMEYIKPLFNSLKNHNCNSDIRCHLVHIVRHMRKRDYVTANNAYMEMAIGNAPWPVGVTRSGIHQRPGSSKSYVSNIAHVLNDETQRKYIQSIKRLISKCQEYFPTDPSKSVDFVPNRNRMAPAPPPAEQQPEPEDTQLPANKPDDDGKNS